MGASASTIGWALSVASRRLGLGAAGKTTILYRLMGCLNFVPIHPTHRLRPRTRHLPKRRFHRSRLRRRREAPRDLAPLLPPRHPGTQAIIYVVDCTDRERIGKARTELHEHTLFREGLKGLPVLVYANKRDVAGALSEDEVAERLGRHSLKRTPWHVQPSCAMTGEGLFEDLQWPVLNHKCQEAVKLQRAHQAPVWVMLMRRISTESVDCRSSVICSINISYLWAALHCYIWSRWASGCFQPS
ncbi:unnamed protein product [Peniophora sp. CBMAI 1063]|nr:unnamed protein product [Peniophora sp. CBMAI 1063]